MQKIKINTKDLKNEIPNLSAGDEVLLSGVVYTARDAAHARLLELMEKGNEKWPDEEEFIVAKNFMKKKAEKLIVGLKIF